MKYGNRLLKMVLQHDTVKLLGPDDVVLDEFKPALVEKAAMMNNMLGSKFVKAKRDLFFNASEIVSYDPTICPVRLYFTKSKDSNYVDIPDKTFKRYKKEGTIRASSL